VKYRVISAHYVEDYPDLQPGDMVVAARDFDDGYANVKKGTLGVCFGSTVKGSGLGPLVRFMNGHITHVEHYMVMVTDSWFRTIGSEGIH
jgi:hypothetical protein